MIEARDITFRYGLKKDFGISGLSFCVEEGMISCLLGKNGCGKTTILKLLYGILSPQSGAVYTNGEKLTADRLLQFHREVAFTGGSWCDPFQSLRSNAEWLSLLYPDFDEAYFTERMEEAGLAEQMDQCMYQLSRGERVKAEIAFALARKPKLLLMDEPFANLDPVYKTDILELLQEMVAQQGMGILLSTHLLDEIESVADHILLLDHGRLVKDTDRFGVLGETEEKQLRDAVKAIGGEE